MDKVSIKNKCLKALVLTLELLALLLALYLIFLPVYPLWEYGSRQRSASPAANTVNGEKEFIQNIKSHLPKNNDQGSSDRLVIRKIGVNIPIIESPSEEYGLSRGTWIVPDGSTPDKGGNTILTGHRFKYLPPSNLTFYLLDKMVPGDKIYVFWRGHDYYYDIKEVKRVEKTEMSIVEPTQDDRLTIYTCDPIFSQDRRLVVVAELTEKD
jgi:LPXTG-site transpeptidase (sortase) family protein